MYKIDPITITDTIFTGSNVPEVDLQEFSPGTAYAVNDTAMVATSTANIHKTYLCKVPQSAGLTANLLDEDCSDISDWTDIDYSGCISEVSPTGQFRFYATGPAGSMYNAYRERILSSAIPTTLTIQIKTYLDTLGTTSNGDFLAVSLSNSTWSFQIAFASDGLGMVKAPGVSTLILPGIVKCSSSAAWQYWRFQINKTTESTATCEVFLKEEGGAWASQGTFDCDYEVASTNKLLSICQFCNTAGAKTSHIDYIKIATGLGLIEDTNTTPVGSTDWLETGSTNRWRAFNAKFGARTEQATKIEYVLTPGEIIDSVALMDIDFDTVDIVLIDSADDLVTNGQSFTGATGTTQPTSWDKVKTPADYTIDSGAIKITTNDTAEGMSQTITVLAATEYQLLFLYKNTSGDTAEYAVYDMTHSADIKATTDLTSDTAYASCSYVFTTPAGCTSIKISFLGKANGDIVWFDNIRLCPTEYSETVTTGSTKTDVVKNDIPEIATGILTVTINKSGTAAIGELIIGNQLYLGEMEYGVQCGIEDYSTIDADAWGNWDITEKGYSKKMTCSLLIENTSFDAIYKALSEDRAQFRVWVGSETYSSMIIYGKYDSFNMVMPGPEQSSCALEIIGLTSGE
jgi:hypothetical protein